MTTRSRSPLLPRYAILPTVAVLAGGCKSDVSTVFDEGEGIWGLESFAIEGGGFENVDMLRNNGFMVKFDPGQGVVAAANCHGADDPTNDSPSSADCDIVPEARTWTCHCFAYDFKDDLMRWLEFNGGPPALPDEMGAKYEACQGVAPPMAGWPHRMIVSEVEGAAKTYTFQALPPDIWGSDGDCSMYNFRIKAESLFEPTGCAAECGIGG